VNKTTISLIAAAILTTGCAGMTDTGERTATGALVGMAGGATIGSIAGDAGWGAVVGAGVGAAGGYVYDRSQKAKGQGGN
jgi:hypothetical protein